MFVMCFGCLRLKKKCSFDTAAQRKVKLINNVILFGVFIPCSSGYLNKPPPPLPNKVHINTEVQESLIAVTYYGFKQGLSVLVLYFTRKKSFKKINIKLVLYLVFISVP